jgi:lipopolysaccharide export system protein LptA
VNQRAIGVILAVMAGAGPAHAQIERSDAPIRVESKTNDVLRGECRAVYEGEVVATQGTARLTTDKLTLQGSRPDGRSGRCEDDRLIAEGNVIYAIPGLRIRGDRAEYDLAVESITFTGDVILAGDDGSLMRGTSLVYSLADERARVTAGDKRVEMIIDPSKRSTVAAAN